MMDESAFEALLKRELAPPEGPSDRSFVARVDHAIVEAELYRRARRGLVRGFLTEAAAVVAIGGSLAFVARVPEVRAALQQTPELAWPALLLVLLLWMLVRGRPAALA